jgi:hypothetical protein
MNASFNSNVVFTVCSNNYLGQAATLQQSLVKKHPDWKFFVALVDVKSPDIDYSIFDKDTLIELNEEIIPGYRNMISRYSIVELNTAVKPFFFEYLVKYFPSASALVYLDPDTFVFHSLQYLNTSLTESAILLTPHFLTPVPIDGLNPPEHMVLNYGLYNLGFLALDGKRTEAQEFLKWWGERTFNFGYHNLCEGLFVDQLWVNLTPVFFSSVQILRHFGMNMGPWNLFERSIVSLEGDNIVLSNGENLLLYHFSSFDYTQPTRMSVDYNRTKVEAQPLLAELYRNYGDQLKSNNVQYYSKLKCQLPLITNNPPLKNKIAGPLISFARNMWKKI